MLVVGCVIAELSMSLLLLFIIRPVVLAGQAVFACRLHAGMAGLWAM
jgi:hypothetical protein